MGRSRCWKSSFLIFAAGILLAPFQSTGEDVTPIDVLFLGDSGLHEPAERAQQLIPFLLHRGIHVYYTERQAELSGQNLARYDAVLLYGNREDLPSGQEKALISFVDDGGAFIGIHSASACFPQSKPFIEMLGGAFASHGTGVFSTDRIKPEHPIVRGLPNITSWDETYVHDRLNPDKTVLAVRRSENGAEPYTWVRERGRGRIFYTAWGHDHRTWEKRAFKRLIERAIRWTTRHPLKPSDATTRLLSPFQFIEQNVPYYPPGGDRSGTGRWFHMQLPRSPEKSQKHVITPPGFEAKLFASEPEIAKPIDMAWDTQGRLWIAETVEYPNEVKSASPARDRIKICEDTDGDGKADRFTVFADGLSLPTSLAFANGGVVVHQPPQTLFLKDTDGDDRADKREVLFEGWSLGDTHAGPNTLRYGLDNHLWGAVGYAGFEGEIAGKTRNFGSSIYRFKPDASSFELVRMTRGNTWGIGFTEGGSAFVSMATSDNPSAYIAVPRRYAERVNGWRRSPLQGVQRSPRFLPITQRVRQVDQHGHFTAATGHPIYTARAYPEKYWNRTGFVGGPTGHLLGTFWLRETGAGYESFNASNLAAADDAWFSPIHSRVGPDGQVWMIDWYNYIIQHNPTPEGYKTGPGNAYESDLRDHERARIYRIVYQGSKPSDSLDLSDAEPDQLVAALSHPNMLWRKHAQRLLVGRGKADVRDNLIALIRERTLDARGLDVGAIHALWTLKGLGLMEDGDGPAVEAGFDALDHPLAGVRRSALRVLPGSERVGKRILEAGVLHDDDAKVRLAALLALTEVPQSQRVGAAVLGMLAEERNYSDPWIRDAATAAGATHHNGFLSAAESTLSAAEAESDSAEPQAQASESNLLSNGSFEKAEGGRPQGWEVRHYAGEAEHDYVEGVAHSGDHALRIRSDEGADSSWHAIAQVEPHARYRLRGWIKTEGVENVGEAYGALLNVHGMGQTTTDALTGTQDWKRVEVEFDAGNRNRIDINCLLGGWGRSRGTAWYDDISLVQVHGPTKGVAHLSEVVRIVEGHAGQLDTEASVSTATDTPLSEYLTGGDPTRGKQIFFENNVAGCIRCHRVNDQGGPIGPDLSGIGARKDRRYLVEALIQPNAVIAEDYAGQISPMPPIDALLSKQEIKDLVAYLESLK